MKTTVMSALCAIVLFVPVAKRAQAVESVMAAKPYYLPCGKELLY
jgi:hypothetical protein